MNSVLSRVCDMYDDKVIPDCRTIIIQNELDDKLLDFERNRDVPVLERHSFGKMTNFQRNNSLNRNVAYLCNKNGMKTKQMKNYTRQRTKLFSAGSRVTIPGTKSPGICSVSIIKPPHTAVNSAQIIKLRTVPSCQVSKVSKISNENGSMETENSLGGIQRRILADKAQVTVSGNKNKEEQLRILTTRFKKTGNSDLNSNASTIPLKTPSKVNITARLAVTRSSLAKKALQATIITKAFTESRSTAKSTCVNNDNGEKSAISPATDIDASDADELGNLLTFSSKLQAQSTFHDESLVNSSLMGLWETDKTNNDVATTNINDLININNGNCSSSIGIPSPPNESPPRIENSSHSENSPGSPDLMKTLKRSMTETPVALTNSSSNSTIFQKRGDPEIFSVSKKPSAPSTKSSHLHQSDDLTSLSWLHSLDMVGMVPHLSTPPTPPASPPISNSTTDSLYSKKKTKTGQELNNNVAKPDPVDYSKDGSVKPPYSYAALISMAMRENGNKMTLSAIYKWIKEHFIYYTTADPSWQNSIRHNLSLNKSFVKVARSKDEPGKGGFWCLDPAVAETLADGSHRKRRPNKPTSPPVTKCTKKNRPNLGVIVGKIVQPVVNESTLLAMTTQPVRSAGTQEILNGSASNIAIASSDGFLTSCTTTLDALGPLDGSNVIIHHPMPYLPPPPQEHNKDTTTDTPYFHQEVISQRTLSLEEATSDTLRDDFSWPSLLDDENHDSSWASCNTQELVTDLAHSGDPSTYLTTPTTQTNLIVSHQGMHPSPSDLMSVIDSETSNFSSQYVNGMHQQQYQQLPSIDSISKHPSHQVMFTSMELSPASSGKLDEELFASPEYTEGSSDDNNSLGNLDFLHQNHKHTLQQVQDSQNHRWDAHAVYASSEADCSQSTIVDHPMHHQPQNHAGNINDVHSSPQTPILSAQQHGIVQTNEIFEEQLPSLDAFRMEDSSFRVDETLSSLTPLQPVSTSTTSVIVQDAHAHCWGNDYPWDVSRTLSMLDPNIDIDKLIELDAL